MVSLFLLAAMLSVLIPQVAVPARAAEGQAKRFIVYVGTMGKAIQAWRMDAETGKMESLGVAAELTRPAYQFLHPNQRFLYSVAETTDGAVCAFSIEAKTGKLTLINRVSSKGAGPCYVSVDKSGRCLMAANYGSGSLAAFPIKEDGSLGEATTAIQDSGSSVNPKRQEGPHAHSINPAPNNRFAIAADLGVDKLFVYRLDAKKAKLTAAEPAFIKTAPGAGPRHTTFSPDGRFLYAINELASSITAYAWDGKKGTLQEVQTVSTLPADFKGENTAAEVRIHPSGKFLYGSNRGHDSIAVFAVEKKTGKLKLIEHVPTQGKTPRNFNLDPTGRWLIAANQAGNNLVVFAIDEKTGKLKDTSGRYEVEAPTCVKFLPVE
jgi:6-phosphogluconolactonase